MLAIWLDPFIPHATKLANDVFKMARMERAKKHTEFGQQVSVITKNSHLQDGGDSGLVRSTKLLQKGRHKFRRFSIFAIFKSFFLQILKKFLKLILKIFLKIFRY